MSELYRRISVRMWGDADFRRLSAPQPNARDLWIYLLTGPHTTPIPGLFTATRAGLAESLKWDTKGFLDVLAELLPEGETEHSSKPPGSDAKRFFEADWDAGVVWIENAIEHNEPQSPNVLKGWKKHFDLIPECNLKEKAFQRLKVFAEDKSDSFAKAFAEAFGKAKRKPLAKARGISGSGSGSGVLLREVVQKPEEETANPSRWTPEDQQVCFKKLYFEDRTVPPSMAGKHIAQFHPDVLATAGAQKRVPRELFVELFRRWIREGLSDDAKKAPYAYFQQAWGRLADVGSRGDGAAASQVWVGGLP